MHELNVNENAYGANITTNAIVNRRLVSCGETAGRISIGLQMAIWREAWTGPRLAQMCA